jgi:phosphoadenosine phosphosulfate reductase
VTHPDPALLALPIDAKVAQSQAVIRQALERFGPSRLAVAITGGKDSTTNLWLVRQVCADMNQPLPVCLFIDEGDVFDEIREFVDALRQDWGLDIAVVKNDDVAGQVANIGDMVQVASLKSENRAALQEIGFTGEAFPFIPDSPVCNHLMKTLPLRSFIRERELAALMTAIRWDEVGAREAEQYFSGRTNPDHTRVHPILHFRERDIWIAIFKYDIPYNSLYRLGYRSLGARCATLKVSDIPAWMQDLEHTPERAGRGEDKEAVMEQLRALGYM